MLINYLDIGTKKLCNFSTSVHSNMTCFLFSGCRLKIMLPSLLCKKMSSLTLLQKYALQRWMATTLVFLTYLLVHLLAKKPFCTLTTRIPIFCYLPNLSKLDTCLQDTVTHVNFMEEDSWIPNCSRHNKRDKEKEVYE